jgi:copper resistance protein B
MLHNRGLLVSAIFASAGVGAPIGAQELDNQIFHYSRVEIDAASTSGPAVGRWLGAGWIGTDLDRLWWSTEGEGADGEFEDVEATALYGRYFRRFWDVVVGYRQDIKPVTQGYLTLGVMGLAPYWFEVGAFGYVSHRGRPSVRLEAETDLFVTQRLVLTPAAEMEWLITSDDALDQDAGISSVEAGFRARYELRRKFAPYVDVLWVNEGATRTPPAEPEATNGLRLGIGLRLIY